MRVIGLRDIDSAGKSDAPVDGQYLAVVAQIQRE
jgi:hypothetical protein